MNEMIEARTDYTRLYKNHGHSIGYWEGWVEPTGLVVMQHCKLLDGKAVRNEYQAEAKNVGRSNETTPFEQGRLELQSRAKKQIDKGYVHTEKEAWVPSTNSLGLEKPMLATPFDKVKDDTIDWDVAFCQPKLDGHRALYKDGVLYSRQGKVLEIPHIEEALKKHGLEEFHLDGELYIHGKSLQELSSLIKRHQEESLQLEYHIYDAVSPDSFYDRIMRVGDRIVRANHAHIKMVQTFPVMTIEMLTAYHEKFRNAGYEGTMLRFGEQGYQSDKRSRNLLKLKEFHDAEWTIINVEEGKPYIRGEQTFHVPVWVLDAGNGKTFTATAQGDMYEKEELWITREQHIGKQLTVRYHYLSADGIPQLPVAIRFREDV